MENEFHDGLQITFCGYVVHFEPGQSDRFDDTFYVQNQKC